MQPSPFFLVPLFLSFHLSSLYHLPLFLFSNISWSEKPFDFLVQQINVPPFSELRSAPKNASWDCPDESGKSVQRWVKRRIGAVYLLSCIGFYKGLFRGIRNNCVSHVCYQWGNSSGCTEITFLIPKSGLRRLQAHLVRSCHTFLSFNFPSSSG